MKRNKKQQYRVTRYELNDKNELVKVDNPVNCNPRKKLPKQLKEMLDKLLFNDLLTYRHLFNYLLMSNFTRSRAVFLFY